MVGKKLWMLLVGIMFINSGMLISSEGSMLQQQLGAYEQAAESYKGDKFRWCQKAAAAVTMAAGIGIYNFLRTTERSAGKLQLLSATLALSGSIYAGLNYMRRFGLNYFAKWIFLRKERQEKIKLRKSLEDTFVASGATCEGDLPGAGDGQKFLSHSAKKEMTRLRRMINFGGLDADFTWVKKNHMIEKSPNYAGKIPEEVNTYLKMKLYPEKYDATTKPVQGLLLLGFPGTGKTTIPDYIAHTLNYPRVFKASASLITKWQGSGPTNLKQTLDFCDNVGRAAYRLKKEQEEQEMAENELNQLGFFSRCFVRARRMLTPKICSPVVDSGMLPTVLCLDEANSILPNRNKMGLDSNNSHGDTTETFLSELAKHPNILVVGTSNKSTEVFDAAVIRSGRLKVVQVGLPDAEDRCDIMRLYTDEEKFPTLNETLRFGKTEYQDIMRASGDLKESRKLGTFKTLIERTPGFSGADLEDLFNTVKQTVGDKNVDRSLNGKQAIEVEDKHFIKALEAKRPIVRERLKEQGYEVDEATGSVVPIKELRGDFGIDQNGRYVPMAHAMPVPVTTTTTEQCQYQQQQAAVL
jgi:hypothetical protein